ncbi:unnamed protein product [Closterium sp. Naga37s-1]|nr:unnamed protein product [Closterium sp. Naga37s-1]
MASPATLPSSPPWAPLSSPPLVDPRYQQREAAELPERSPSPSVAAIPAAIAAVPAIVTASAPACLGAAGAGVGGVCLSDFNEGELIRFLRPCEHQFHVACIDHWLATKTTCPVCRTDLQSPDPIAITDESEVRTDKVEGGDNAV